MYKCLSLQLEKLFLVIKLQNGKIYVPSVIFVALSKINKFLENYRNW